MRIYQNDIGRDAAIVALSVAVAVLLVRTDALSSVLASSREFGLLGSFVVGMFFTSIFTVAPATVTLAEIAQAGAVLSTAIAGGLGAVVGDLIIFRFVRDRLSEHLAEVLKRSEGMQRLKALFRYRIFRWLTILAGGLIIASPLPDELGIGLLGFSKVKTALFIPLSFVLNSIGIYVIGVVARSLG